MENSPQQISLDHQKKIDAQWKPLCLQHNLIFAEYSFANAFLYRRQHQYQLVEHPLLLIKGRFKQEEAKEYLIPTFSPERFSTIPLQVLKERSLFPIPDFWLPGCGELAKEFSEDDSDYLYERSKLATLRGRVLSSRRNLLHQLLASHQLESFPLTESRLSDAAHLTEVWQSKADLSKEKTDYYSCLEALEHINLLGLFGRIAYADGVAVGYTVGELLTPKTALLHILKANHEYKGIVPFLNQDFALNLPESVEWINMEQDLGIPALRQAKRAYAPDKIVTKWRLSIYPLTTSPTRS